MERLDVVLRSGGGDITVGRQISHYVYGAFDVVLPEGREQQESDDRIRDGYIYRPPEVPEGRFDVGFVRADVSLDLNTSRGSDLERVVDAAVKRVEGDVFFERDIDAAGVAPFVPGVDFGVHDTVSVELWGKRLRLPVTALDFVESGVSGLGGVRVHVGGQVLSDAEALRSQSDEALARVERERRQRLADVGRASRAAARAQSTADSAQSAADGAQSTADAVGREAQELRDALSGGGASSLDVRQQLEELNRQLQERGESAPDGLIPAYIAANTMRWRLQDYTNELLAWQVRTLQESAAWSQKYAPYGFALPGFNKTVVKPFLRIEVGDASGLSANEARFVNTSRDVRLRVSYGYSESTVFGTTYKVSEAIINPGESRVDGSSGSQRGSFLVIVTPDPVRPFEPSPPPAMPRN
ncbi:hypothetical protein FYJ88_03855 [Corynebacterium urealyticum]|uniref:hypothetical protein n=1 Tax=Corynebacterium urealyticum TaxID=43771 RepID=UPI0011E6C1E2|nr:hypothetical protein [Corynebacterium urealyticum]TYR17970.1 hypothetical protein FYJ88_03855 [Corynebacterium urealyticum]